MSPSGASRPSHIFVDKLQRRTTRDSRSPGTMMMMEASLLQDIDSAAGVSNVCVCTVLDSVHGVFPEHFPPWNPSLPKTLAGVRDSEMGVGHT